MYAYIHDAKRFILYNRSIIEEAPLQAYCSALVFAPEGSLVRNQFENQIPGWISKLPKVERLEFFAADARGPFGCRQRRGILAGRQAGGVGIVRRDGQAMGRGHGSGAAEARGPFECRQRRGILAGRQAGVVPQTCSPSPSHSLVHI